VTLVVITWIPSPYQVELFDALAQQEPGLRVIYVARREKNRGWANPELRHEAMFLDDAGPAHGEFFRWVDEAELTVFSYYSCKPVREAMRRREALQKPWCFWGERPGYHRLGRLGQLRRRFQLAPLHRGRHVPIWGIGKWAIDGYRREFGDDRLYCNVPYFSDLERFRTASASRRAESEAVRIVYSGALIKRKGVDLLAKAFRRLGQTRANATLSLIGAGPLRAVMESTLRPLGSRVCFHDFVPWHDLPRFYAQADVLCAPSRYDGWGLIVPEGMASGMPVIATERMGSALELIENGENGWLIRAGDEDELYETLCAAVDIAPSRRAAMGSAAQFRSHQQSIAEGVQRFQTAAEGTLAAWRQPTSLISSAAKSPARTLL
jgi:glycosyltransferase involved in cell wall biosynthesis